MCKAALLSIVAVLAAVAAGQVADLGLAVGKDLLPYKAFRASFWYSDEYQYIQPFGVYLTLEVPLVEFLKFGLRGGFVHRTSFSEVRSGSDTTKDNTSLTGGRGQAFFLVEVPVVSRFFLRGGFGLGYHGYSYTNEYQSLGPAYFRQTETSIIGSVQTFILGAGFPVSDRVSLILEIEKVGLGFLKEKYRVYDEDGDLRERGEQTYLKQAEWADINDAGFILGVRVGF